MSTKVIAIDGPAGAGKSTTAKAVAQELGLAHLDSGALYRAITLAALNAGGLDDQALIVDEADRQMVELRDVDGRFVPFLNGAEVSKEVRSTDVTDRVSTVSALPAVRHWATERLREAVSKHPRGAVADGRDVGSVVFPDAVLKIFLTANLDARAMRRALEMENSPDVANLKVEIESRDDADRNREISPLIQAADAILIDTSVMAFEEQVAKIVELGKRWWDAAN